MKHQNTLLTILTLSTVMLFGIGTASARSSEVSVSKNKAGSVKVARSERGVSNRQDNKKHYNSRNQQNNKPTHEPRQPVPRADRDRKYSPKPNQNHRNADRNDQKRDYREAYRRSSPQHQPRYYRTQPGYWRDYHRGYKHGYQHRYHNGQYYYYNQVGFYFPGFGYIAHGHIHGHYCPDWHFQPFAAGLILGAILSH